MSQDQFVETTSWWSRLGNSLLGIFFGIILVLGSFILLFWNEGRSAKQISTLNEGRKFVVEISSTDINSVNEGKLVCLKGEAHTDEILEDSEFGVKENAIKLRRQVQIYQWREHTKSADHGSTIYTYTPEWSEHLISSADFKEQAGHKNPQTMKYSSKAYIPNNVTIDAFLISKGLKDKMNNYSDLGIDNTLALPSSLEGQAKKENDGFYFGKDSTSPEIGDLRVKFLIIHTPSDFTIVAKQVGNSFEPYHTSNGGVIEMIQAGKLSSEEMFQRAFKENKIWTWGLRGLGIFLMYIGFLLIVNPLMILVDVVPFFGKFIENGVAFIVFLITVILSFSTIGIAWLFFRPLLSVPLLIVAAGTLYLLTHKLKNSKGTNSSSP